MLGAEVGTNGHLEITRPERPLELCIAMLEGTKQGLLEQRLLRLEVRVEGADGQVHLAHDLRESHGLDAMFAKQARRGLDDALARGLVVLLGVSHLCSVPILPFGGKPLRYLCMMTILPSKGRAHDGEHQD